MERRGAVVCDDDPVTRHLVSVLLAAAGFSVVAEVDVAVDALHVAELAHPAVAVVDVGLMGMSGIEAIPALRAAGCEVVVFSAFDSVAAEARAAGARAVVDKASPHELERVLAELAATEVEAPAS